jgi:hypothetical protein
MGRASLLLLPLACLGACTALVGDRQRPADLGADAAAGGDDLAGRDMVVTVLDFSGADLTGVLGLPTQANSSISITPGSVVADGSSNAIVQVVVKDESNNPVVGEPVVLSHNGTGTNTITPASGITNGLGVFSATISSTKAEPKTVTATVFGFQLSQMVTFTAGSVVQGKSSIGAMPGTIVANDVETSTVTVTLLDANDNPVPGASVAWSGAGAGDTLTPVETTTTMAGTASATLKTQKSGMKTVTATVNGFMLNQSITANPGNVDATHSTLVASPTSGLAANGSSGSTITATLLDVFDNPVSGKTVVFASGAGTAFSVNNVASDGSGVATTTLSATTSGMKTVTATGDGVAINQSAMVTFDACPSATNTLPSGTLRSGNTAGGTNVYHPVCAGTPDSTERVYTLSPSTQSVIIDRGPTSFAGAVTDVRPSSSGCSIDSQSIGCTSGRYLYCPSLNGSYDVVVDGANASGAFDVRATLAAPKGANSYGVLTITPAATFTSIVGTANAVKAIAETALVDGIFSTTLPFAFRFFGVDKPAGTAITLFQSGYIGFASSPNTRQNVCPLPSTGLPAETIAPFWSRLATRNGINPAGTPRGSVWYVTQGSAPNRTFVVEWALMDAYNAAGNNYECIRVSVQAILYESTNYIEFRYRPENEDTCGNNTTTDKNYAIGGHSSIGLQGAQTGVIVESAACSAADGLGPATLGSCTDGGGSADTCTADKGYFFIPKSPGCP